jgi:hypothetical protein
MQTIHFNPDGTISRPRRDRACCQRAGRGDEPEGRRPRDWLPGTNEIVFSAGPHPVREAIELENFQTALAAFCEVLA